MSKMRSLMGVYAMAAMVSSQNYGYDRPNYAPPLSDRKPLNKKQKQLINTYIRKREIAVNVNNTQYYDEIYELIDVDESHPNYYKLYEYNFLITNDLLKPDKLPLKNIVYFLITKPETINLFKYAIPRIHGAYLRVLLIKQPQFISLINNYDLNDLNNDEVADILTKQPDLINYFKHRLNNIDKDIVQWMLRVQPQLEPYFKEWGVL